MLNAYISLNFPKDVLIMPKGIVKLLIRKFPSIFVINMMGKTIGNAYVDKWWTKWINYALDAKNLLPKTNLTFLMPRGKDGIRIV